MISTTEMARYAERLAMILSMDRPITFFDLESTGTDATKDRIVQLSLLKISPDGSHTQHTHLVHPGRPIPPASTAVHSITDEDVEHCLRFATVAPVLRDILIDSDLAGFNIYKFDLSLLVAEFDRAGVEFDYSTRAIVDLMTIFHKLNPRDLGAAVKQYAPEIAVPFEEQKHDAAVDSEVCLPVLTGQLLMHKHGLPRTVAELGEYCKGDRVDLTSKFKMVDSKVTFAFSKMAGRTLADVAKNDSGFLSWMLKQTFPTDVVKIVKEAQAARREEIRLEAEARLKKREEKTGEVIKRFKPVKKTVLCFQGEEHELKPEADYTGAEETAEILADKEFSGQLALSIDEMKAGKAIPLKDALNEFDEAAAGLVPLEDQDRRRDIEDHNGESTLDKIKSDIDCPF